MREPSVTTSRTTCGAALGEGELREGTDLATLAKLVETTYHGAMIGWAIHRESTLADWMRAQVEAVLAPHRGAS